MFQSIDKGLDNSMPKMIGRFNQTEKKKSWQRSIVAACAEAYKSINAAGILFRLASKQPSMCVGVFIVSSMMAPARIGVCLICRAKLVHKKKFLVGGMYTGL